MSSTTYRGRRSLAVYGGVLLACLGLGVSPAAARALDFEQRVAAQRAIEEVYWRHRVWPRENPTPKPALATVMPDEAIRARVEAYLEKSVALEERWQHPVTARELQAELDRMSVETRDPATLRELYAALGNDAFLIAETLARQTLVERRVQRAYSADERIHGALQKEAERKLAGVTDAAGLKALGGRYFEQTFVRTAVPERTPRRTPVAGVIELAADDWTTWTHELGRRYGTEPARIPLQHVSDLLEDPDRYFVTMVLSLQADEAVLAGVVWPKRSFDAWWEAERPRTRAEVAQEDASYQLAASPGAACIDDTWEQHFFPPGARAYHEAVWTGAEMIVWGGSGDGGHLNSGGRYSPSTDSWTATSTGAGVPAPRVGHTVVWTGTEVVIWGGYGEGIRLNTGGRYDPATDRWTATSTGANVPVPRDLHTAVWTGTEMIIWGGSAAGGPTNTGARYGPSTDSWTATSTGASVPVPRAGHTAVWTGTEVIVWGGSAAGGLTHTGARYDPSTDSWTATSTGANVPVPRVEHTAVWTGTEMIVWSGHLQGTSYTNTGGRYDPSTNSWAATSTGANVPGPRGGHTAVWTGTQMFAWGGFVFDGSSRYLNTGGLYDPATDSWTGTSTGANVPARRTHHTAVWTGTDAIVWGGFGLGGWSLDTGGRYDPAADGWTPTSTGASVPAARFDHTAVWTGTEMIVWGGTGSSGALDTGGRYVPATNSWTATSTGTNVPAPREDFTALWTGTEMIVWGGYGASDLNTGGRYNPATDSWTATATGTNTPAARSLHTAVWTGAEMIVWGGRFLDASFVPHDLDTGGRYDPTTDSWVATSTGTDAPDPRSFHTAVWTGTEMIVWGGRFLDPLHFFHDLDTGGRYDPGTDSWSATSTGTNVPAARYGQTAVWTGSEMIVWGGKGLSTGGRYDPATDGWTATSTAADAPEGRGDHTAVWTGTEMIVWGGNGQSGPRVNTGGRYDPATDLWKATSTGANVPEGRRFHTAVWTVAEMIVWGGEGTDQNVALYCAAGPPSASDLDGDGRPDILWRNAASGDTGAWSMNGTAVEGWLALPTEPPSSGWQIEGLGNFDDAGDADVLWRNAFTGQTGVWRLTGGDVTGWAWLPTEPPDSGWHIRGVGDFDGNGISDVLWRNADTGETGAWILDAPGNEPSVVAWIWLPTEPTDSGWEIQGVGDFTGEGSADVLWRNTTTGEVGAWILDGPQVVGWVWMATEPTDSGWETQAVVDLTADGVSEVLWRHGATGQVGAWLMDGTSVAGWAWLPTEPPSSGWEIEGPR